MMFSTSGLALFVAFMLSNVSCSLNAECKTGKDIVLEQFSDDTNEMFKKTLQIKSCGADHFNLNLFDDKGYNKCIADLGLPKSYETTIAKFSDKDFKTDNAFSSAMRRASYRVCKDLNFEYKAQSNDNEPRIYTITGPFLSGKYEKVLNTSVSETPLHSETHSSSYGNIYVYYMIGLLVMVILISSIIFIYTRVNRNFDKLAPVSEPKRYPDQYPNFKSAIQHPVPMNTPLSGSAPPSYNEVILSGYSSASPTNPSNSNNFIGNPYSGKGDPY